MPGLQSKREQKTSKIGSNVRIVLQKRDVLLLETLRTFRIVDRNQTARICGFNSLTRVNTRLQKLTAAGLLKRFFFVSALGGKKAVYSLSKKGADLIGAIPNGLNRPSDSFLIGDKFVAHQLAVNEVYLAAHINRESRLQNWRVFSRPVSERTRLIPDGYFEIHSNGVVRPMFLEVDLGTEGLAVWNKKIRDYLSFAQSGEFEKVFGHPRFSVLVLTFSERRMHSLRAHIRKTTSKLFYFSTLKTATQDFWSPIWLRPEGDNPQSLI